MKRAAQRPTVILAVTALLSSGLPALPEEPSPLTLSMGRLCLPSAPAFPDPSFSDAPAPGERTERSAAPRALESFAGPWVSFEGLAGPCGRESLPSAPSGDELLPAAPRGLAAPTLRPEDPQNPPASGISDALAAMALPDGEPATPPEPRREEKPESRAAWFKSRAGVTIMVVAGAVLVGMAALRTIDEDS